MKHITCVIGTRPEVLKMAPVINALSLLENTTVNVIITAQHRNLLDQMLDHFNIKVTIDFNVMTENQQLNSLTAALLNKFEDYFKQHSCDLIIAQGDTTTTMAAALSAFYHKIPFAHVEAGLRTHDVSTPFPEELNRRITSQIATLHFCPTDYAKNNLAKEGIHENVYVTGNTIIDTLYSFTKKINNAHDESIKTILVTCHRRENFGKPLENICAALKLIAQENKNIKIIFPVHPNPNIKAIVYKQLANMQNIQLTEPLDYKALTTILAQCFFVITDSGGLQEEAPALQKPVLILRNETERPEGIHCGAAKIVGTNTDSIVIAINELLHDHILYAKMSQAGSPYGKGDAGLKIAQRIFQYFKL